MKIFLFLILDTNETLSNYPIDQALREIISL